MNVLVAVCSRSRAHVLPRTVLRIFSSPALRHFTCKCFVEPHQFKDYSLFVPSRWLHRLDHNHRGLALALHSVGHYANAAGYDLVLKVDDDIRRFLCRGRAHTETLQVMLDDCIRAFELFPQLGGVGFPYSHQMFDVVRWVGCNQRLQTCYFTRPQFLQWDGPEHGIWEDFTRTALIRRAGSFTLRYGFAGMDCIAIAGTNLGGLQDFDRTANATRSRLYLDSLIPDLVWRKVKKPWDHEPDFARTPSLRGFNLELNYLPPNLPDLAARTAA